MSANQRRSGFRLPWLADSDESDEGKPSASGAVPEPAGAEAPRAPAATNGSAATSTPVTEATTDPSSPSDSTGAGTNGEATPEPTPSAPAATRAPEVPQAVEATVSSVTPAEAPSEFLRELISAMRSVADEARRNGVEKLKVDADEAVRTLETDAEKRRQDLRERAEADITGVGEWARAEAERIKAEAEQRVAARRTQLEQQLAAEGTRTEAESKALRARVDDYERELEAYYAQLSEISDPAAFAAAAKRMPPPPELTPRAAIPAVTTNATEPAAAIDDAAKPTDVATDAVHPAEEEVLAARLAELDAELDPAAAPDPASADGAPVTTDVVVKGLGSFGAITGFRQALSGQPGISAVALSLGQSGEFVFRATHAPDFDLGAAITAMEGDGAMVEPRPEGGLRVTLERAR